MIPVANEPVQAVFLCSIAERSEVYAEELRGPRLDSSGLLQGVPEKRFLHLGHKSLEIESTRRDLPLGAWWRRHDGMAQGGRQVLGSHFIVAG